MRDGSPVLMDDVTETDGSPTLFASLIDAGPIMVLPLAGSAGRRGVLTLIRFRGRQPFGSSDLAMANGFAAHASVALEPADSRVAEQRLALLEDRDRIARDLHDHVIQELSNALRFIRSSSASWMDFVSISLSDSIVERTRPSNGADLPDLTSPLVTSSAGPIGLTPRTSDPTCPRYGLL